MAAALSSCHNNPFMQEWDTPYGIPPFEKIRTADYIPAIREGIAQQQAEIEAICNNAEAPTFENTIAAFELSGELLSKVCGVLYNVSETDNSPSLDAVMEEAIPLLSAHSDNISFNKALYERVAAVYNADQSALTREQQVVLKNHYDDFQRNGVGLGESEQKELRDINTQMAAKIQKIGNNILAESNAFKDKFGFSVSAYPDMMTSTADREQRRAWNEAYTTRCHSGGEHDNAQLILEVMQLRIRKAEIMGYTTSADYTLADKMAHDSWTVDTFLDGIMRSAVARAEEEKAAMQALMDQDIASGLLPAGSVIEPWDWWYYAERVRKARYDLDENLTKPYFSIDNVVKGIFTCAEILYGIKAEKLEGVSAYNRKCVTTYKITDADGSLIGIFTTDYFPRSSKRGGAWMNPIREQYTLADGTDVRPIIVNVGNLHANLSIDEVQTVFHEFGHALHGLLTKCHYASVSGTNVTRDFVEMFSQFNENWAFQPWLLERYALNGRGEVIPASLVEKVNAALKFNQGFMTTELAAASILDMKWHELEEIPASALASPEAASAFIDAFEKRVCDEMGLIREIAPRYRTTYFNHIFGSGYNSGYYGYLWAEVLDKDAFSVFTSKCAPEGEWDLEAVHALAMEFRATFLEKGGSEEPMTLYRSFVGREPDPDAMLRGRGLK